MDALTRTELEVEMKQFEHRLMNWALGVVAAAAIALAVPLVIILHLAMRDH
jgi:hypothetical protein